VPEAVKVALLISGANKARYGQLKEQLANNYLLCTDQLLGIVVGIAKLGEQVAKNTKLK
jgi:hypothetical protein